jgi:hypothetical protein
VAATAAKSPFWADRLASEAVLSEERLWGDTGTKNRYNPAGLSPEEATKEAV